MKNRIELTEGEYSPSPIGQRICNCGCGHYFQPNRKDQLYINKKHYDFYYNQTKRKEKNKHILSVEKVLKLNNRLLERHYEYKVQTQKREPVICYLDNLKADGFTTKNYIGIIEQKSKRFFCLYNYNYCLCKNTNNQLIIEIYKKTHL